MNPSQQAAYHNEMRRLHERCGILSETIQTLQDALADKNANHRRVVRAKAELITGFCRSDPDGAALPAGKVDTQHAGMTNTATELTTATAERNELKDKLGEVKAEHDGRMPPDTIHWRCASE